MFEWFLIGGIVLVVHIFWQWYKVKDETLPSLEDVEVEDE